MLLLLIAISIIFLVYKFATHRRQHWKRKGIDYFRPGLNGFTSAESIVNAYNKFPESRFTGISAFNRPILMIRDPEVIRNVLIRDFENFADRSALVQPEIDKLFGNNLLSLNGQQWTDLRRKLSPAFASSNVKAMFDLINKCGQQMTNYIDEALKNQSETDAEVITLEMKDFFGRYVSDVIATIAFGINVDSVKDPENEFNLIAGKVVNPVGLTQFRFILSRTLPTLMKLFKIGIFGEDERIYYRKMIRNGIRRREEEGIVRPDVIHSLMDVRKATPTGEKSGKRLISVMEDEIAAQSVMFLLAGWKSVMLSLSHTAYELAMNPAIQSALQREIDLVLQQQDERGANVTFDGVTQKMKYLDMVINESLRKWPPSIRGNRIVSRDYVIGKSEKNPEVTLKSGDEILIPIIAIHRDSRYYPEPEVFDPSRFSEKNRRKIDAFTYLPFGNGPRKCIGMEFALIEMKTCLVHLLRKYTFKVISKTISMKLPEDDQFIWLGLQSRTSTRNK